MPDGPSRDTTIRALTDADVDAAADVILRGGWGDRGRFFEWALGQPGCRPIVAVDAGGTVVGTGVGSIHGPVGWVGTIFVDEAWRGRGLGAALTRRVTDDLEAAGCRSLVLIATDLGRPVYERQGFIVQTRYHQLRTVAGGAVALADARRHRPYRAADLQAIVALDRVATGEDRSAVLASFAAPERCRVAIDATGAVTGFAVHATWGGWAVIAPDPTDALRLLAWRRASARPDAMVVAGLPSENVIGRTRLAGLGWSDAVQPVRMIRGDPVDWQPTSLWGQFGGAIG